MSDEPTTATPGHARSNVVPFRPRTPVVDLAWERLNGRVSLEAFLESRGIEIVDRPPPTLLNDSIVATVRNKLWHHHFRRYVELPGDVVRSELADELTPRQIQRARRALGIRVVKRADGWWWQPHPRWPTPRFSNAPRTVGIRKIQGGSVGYINEWDLEPDGYYWR